MAILKSCCCGKSLRRGSYASAIFTMSFSTVLLIGAALHINTASSTSTVLLLATVSVLICSVCCVLSSLLLIIGLCVDNRLMLLPWIVSVSVNTALNLFLFIYFITETTAQPSLESESKEDDLGTLTEDETATGIFTASLYTFDFVMCALNMYCLLCVISQYQEYLIGRGYAQDPNQPNQPVVRLQPSHSHAVNKASHSAMKNAENGLLSPSSALGSSGVSSSSQQHLLAPRPYIPALRSPLELSSISEEPSSHDPAPKISTDDTSLDDEVSHTSSSFGGGGRTVYSLPVPPLPTGARLARQDKEKNKEKEKGKQETTKDNSHLLETICHSAPSGPTISAPTVTTSTTASRSSEDQHWI